MSIAGMCAHTSPGDSCRDPWAGRLPPTAQPRLPLHVMAATAPAAVPELQRYPIPRWSGDDERLRPIHNRLTELLDQSDAASMVRITTWQGHTRLGQILSTVRTAITVVIGYPYGNAEDITIEACGDLA